MRVRWARVAGVAVAGFLLAGVVGSRLGTSGVELTTGPGSRVYVVKSGDTVWSIVGREAGPGIDPRPLVDRLIRLNHLRDAVIRPGQRLILPTDAVSPS